MQCKQVVGLKTKLGFDNCFAVDRVGFGWFSVVVDESA